MNIKVIGGEEFKTKMAGMPSRVHQALLTKVYALAAQLEAYVKDEKLSGQVLNHISGNLWRSIKNQVTDSPTMVTGKVYSDGSVKYAAIHEFGFSGSENVKEHVRRMASGKVATVRSFTRTMNMPMRSFLRSSLGDNKDKIISGLKKAAADGMAS